jgi:4-hydroxyacetophenone monooxygenase
MTSGPRPRTVSVTEGLRNASDEQILGAVEVANIWALWATLLQVSDDPAIRDMESGGAGLVTGEAASDRVAPPAPESLEDHALLRKRAVEWLQGLRDGAVGAPHPPTDEDFGAVARLVFGRPDLSNDEVAYWREESGVDELPRALPLEAAIKGAESFHVLVIGAGMNGISAGVYLKAAGIPFTIVDKNDGVGGTWHENVYPGIRVDVASRAYCFTYEPDYPWQHHFAVGKELHDYLDFVVDKYGIREHIRFGAEVESATWDEDAKSWAVTVSTGDGSETLEANLIISAVGLLNRANPAPLPGLEAFQGKVMHTAEWDSSYDLSGKRVALIGTGSSGVQLAGPLSELCSRLYVFQRAGAWIANVPNYVDPIDATEQWLLGNVPYYVNWVRVMQMYAVGDTRTPIMDIDPDWDDPNSVNLMNHALRESLMAYIHDKLADRPDLLNVCVPAYPPLAKRLPKDNGWYDAIKKDHVSLVTSGIECVTGDGIRTVDGEEHPCDLIVLATGFHANRFLWPMKIVGRDGATLDETWSPDGPRAYLGMAIPGFPNLFCLYGPNTNGKSGSPVSWGEMQVRYVAGLIQKLLESGNRSAEIKKSVYEEFNAWLDERSKNLIFMDPRQSSYYRNEFNRSATNGCWLNKEYWVWTRTPDMTEFVVD